MNLFGSANIGSPRVYPWKKFLQTTPFNMRENDTTPKYYAYTKQNTLHIFALPVYHLFDEVPVAL